MALADVHAHLTHPRLKTEPEASIAAAVARGVTTIISNGLNPEDNRAVLELSQRFDIVRPAFGLYPVDAVLAEMREQGVEYKREGPAPDVDETISWIRAHADECIAIGEIGLDGHWVPEDLWARQEDVFRQFVTLAMDLDKPMIIHTRRRERRALEILDEMGAERVNWHCFGGRVKLARQIAERGHYLSIPANARRSESFTRMLETLPRDRLLLETDCPYLSPDRERGSTPADVAGTADYAAELWGAESEAVAEIIGENFSRLFGREP